MDLNFLYLVFHGDTRELLRPGQQNGIVSYPLEHRAAIKDIIEATGVPHTEVGRFVHGGRDLTHSNHIVRIPFCHDVFARVGYTLFLC
jgi:isopropylmalate/homocitrate/citramalate synthase